MLSRVNMPSGNGTVRNAASMALSAGRGSLGLGCIAWFPSSLRFVVNIGE